MYTYGSFGDLKVEKNFNKKKFVYKYKYNTNIHPIMLWCKISNLIETSRILV